MEAEVEVDMEIDAEVSSPSMSAPRADDIRHFVVIDTNILNHYLDVFSSFVDDVGRFHCLLPITFIIPGIVIRELDSQQHRKSMPELALMAANASRWLAASRKSPALIREQSDDETLRPSGNWKVGHIQGEVNDDLIIDCCQFFKAKGGFIVLWTEDNLLLFRSKHNAADVVLKRPHDVKETDWNSQAVARVLDFPADLAAQFSCRARERSGRKSGRPGGRGAGTTESLFVDWMDVDYVLSIDPKDALHVDAIERLGNYMRELIDRVMPRGVREGVGRSEDMLKKRIKWKRTRIEDWTLYDRIQYTEEGGLSGGGLGWLTEREANHLTEFLTPRSEANGYPTAKGKPGNTWTTAQWRSAVASLDKIGRRAAALGFGAIAAYVEELRRAGREINLEL